MLILTRREGETIHIGDAITLVVSKITPQRVRIDLALTQGTPVSLEDIHLSHGGFVRRYVERGQTFKIGEQISLIVCTKDRTPSQVAIGITAPRDVNIARGELLVRARRAEVAA